MDVKMPGIIEAAYPKHIRPHAAHHDFKKLPSLFQPGWLLGGVD
jgi:hypothetical protein